MEPIREGAAREESSESERKELIRRYAEEIRERSKIPFIEPLRAWNTVAVRWSLGAAVVLIACMLQARMLLRPADVHVPRPTAALLAIEAGDACGRRQAAIVQALATYTKHHGGPPASLDLLGAPYLYEDPIDPDSGHPYEYSHEAGAFIVACPNPRGHLPEQP
jgi:hypothetical protein